MSMKTSWSESYHHLFREDRTRPDSRWSVSIFHLCLILIGPAPTLAWSWSQFRVSLMFHKQICIYKSYIWGVQGWALITQIFILSYFILSTLRKKKSYFILSRPLDKWFWFYLILFYHDKIKKVWSLYLITRKQAHVKIRSMVNWKKLLNDLI